MHCIFRFSSETILPFSFCAWTIVHKSVLNLCDLPLARQLYSLLYWDKFFPILALPFWKKSQLVASSSQNFPPLFHFDLAKRSQESDIHSSSYPLIHAYIKLFWIKYIHVHLHIHIFIYINIYIYIYIYEGHSIKNL